MVCVITKTCCDEPCYEEVDVNSALYFEIFEPQREKTGLLPM